MNPRKTFLFGLYVIVLIFVVSEFVPGGTMIGNFTIQSPDYRSWFQLDTTKYKDISAIIASVDTTDFQATVTVPENLTPDNKVDSVQQSNNPDTPADNFYPFEFPPDQDTLLFPFFRSLTRMHLRNRPIRILHYGDSQIEGDRITSTIRNHIHRNHGGQGIGFLPIVPVARVAITFQRDVSQNWKRFSMLDRGIDTIVRNNRFGISGNFVRYLPANSEDSVARIRLLPYYSGYRNEQTFTNVRLYYGQGQEPFTVIVNQNVSQILQPQNSVSSTLWKFDAAQNSFDLQLVSSHLPDIYGIALDGERGVAVDNLPLRGSAGLNFSRNDREQMRQMFLIMDVEILILQFGANAVSARLENYDTYARNFERQLRHLKSLKPGLAIIVVSVNDMSQNTPSGYVSFPNIEKMRDAQKQAAFEAGCVFWDLYEAMGGENSMPSWALAKPPLAQKDFVHFTPAGAKIVGELFCKAWANEYQRFSFSNNNI